MKSILLSIKPEWVAKILNGEKTIEIRKKFPENYVGWVHIYCTKGELLQAHWGICNNGKDKHILYGRKCKDKDFESPHTENGKVVARFWCDKVEEIKYTPYDCTFYTDTLDAVRINTISSLEKASCLDYFKLHDYLYNGKEKVGYAIHISKLEVFDEPRELSEFRLYYCNCPYDHEYCTQIKTCEFLKVKIAPQNYCYIEMGE